MDLHPISELKREHKGYVMLVNINEWAYCIGQMGRLWSADESAHTRGTDNPLHLRWCGFSHFIFLKDIEAAEREHHEKEWGPMTDSERAHFDSKYRLPLTAPPNPTARTPGATLPAARPPSAT